MLMRIFLVLLSLPLLGVLWLAYILVPAHWQIRQMDSPLPQPEDLRAALQLAGGPDAVSYINTASQRSPVGTIGHPGVLLEWPDGRRFLIDTGMPPEQAMAFGKPMERLLDAQPTETFGAIDTQLGPALQSISGIAFTHLHSDHTDGLVPLCAAQAQPARVFQTPRQREQLNYTTRRGETSLGESKCFREVLGDGVIKSIPGFPGLLAIAAGGHTPGSTLYVARVQGTTWIFAGDITNDMHSLHNDLDKPWIYSTFIVPEDTRRLQQLRRWLEALDQTPGLEVLVAHDIEAFEASGIPRWTAADAP